MIDLSRTLVERERYRDMLRKAEKERLIKTVLTTDQLPSNLVYSQLLAGLGRLLTDWGLRLQKRYGTVAKIPPGHHQVDRFSQKTLALEAADCKSNVKPC